MYILLVPFLTNIVFNPEFWSYLFELLIIFWIFPMYTWNIHVNKLLGFFLVNLSFNTGLSQPRTQEGEEKIIFPTFWLEIWHGSHGAKSKVRAEHITFWGTREENRLPWLFQLPESAFLDSQLPPPSSKPTRWSRGLLHATNSLVLYSILLSPSDSVSPNSLSHFQGCL